MIYKIATLPHHYGDAENALGMWQTMGWSIINVYSHNGTREAVLRRPDNESGVDLLDTELVP